MKKIFVTVLILMTLGTSAYASTISQQWIKTYGGPEDGFHCIQQTIDGGYVAAGFTRTFAPGASIYLWVLKFDANGNVSWQKTYHYGTWINDAYSIQQTIDGGYIVAGFTAFASYPMGGWILRLDSSGEIVWQKFFEGVIEFKSIQQIEDGGYITVGETESRIGGTVSRNAIVLKLDDVGDIVWQKSYDILNASDNPTNIQRTTDGGYVVTGHSSVSGYDIFVLRLNSEGDVSWVKIYDGGGGNTHPNIQETSDGGFILVSCVYCNSASEDLWLMKLGNSGIIEWQKTYGGNMHDRGAFVQQIIDGGYVVIGHTASFGHGGSDAWLMKLDNGGNIEWEKTYGGSLDDGGSYFGNTQDGGYAVVGYSDSLEPIGLMILKLDNNGEIPGCDIEDVSNATVSDTTAIGQDVSASVESSSIIVTATDSIPQGISVETAEVCYYENLTDIDGDGVENNPDGAMASSVYGSSFLAEEDNCSEAPNGPYLGTCTKGNVGSTCIANEACGVDGICSMNQEDTYPPQGNGMGDACDCEGNFNCDDDCDGSDAFDFKTDFGRSTIQNPCESGNPCNGDFDCDSDCDGTDASLFKADFGRSSFNNPCPACVVDDWCVYQ